MLRVFRPLVRDRESGWGFTALLCVPYLAFLVWMHVHHEMWRDEIHFWTMARMADGFRDLVTGDRIYDGHPPLWYWYLRVWTWFTHSSVGIHMATVAAAMGAAVLLVRFAPFPRYLKVLLLFSYYMGYEHTVLSRNYVLSWLFACLFCALYHPFRLRHGLVALAVGFLSLGSFYGLALSMFLLGFLVLEQVKIQLRPAVNSAPRLLAVAVTPRFAAALAAMLAAMVFCILTIEPPDPNPFSPAFVLSSINLKAFPEMMYRITSGFLPWRHFSMSEFWAMFFTFWERDSIWPVYVGAALSLATLLALWPSWRLMLVYFWVGIGMLFFQQARHEGLPRHWGHFFLAFVAACWLLRTTFPRRHHYLSTALLVGMCAVQVQPFVVATAIDTRHTFSGARETAAFIERAGLQDLPIVGGPDYNVSSIAGFLRRPFHAAETEEVNQTVLFHNRRREFSPHELMDRAVKVARDRKSPVVLISNQWLPEPPAGFARALLFSSRLGTIADETFSVYKLQANEPATMP
ncbi:MAG: hypothetical protein JXP73_09645 [Deltaproteobacteria bacterium]|nr:hypothetical protein [Deltaproteobacteria bacterium]